MMKKYLELERNNSATHMKVELYYSLGGYNYFTGRQEERGYYLSVSPVKREQRGGCMLESYAAFSGLKFLMNPVKRRSAKQEAEAERIAAERMDALVRVVLDKNGLRLAGEA